MVAIVFGAFRIGVRAWEKGEKDIEARHRQRVVLNSMQRQLASLVVREETEEGIEKDLFQVKGEERSLRFVTQVPMIPGNAYGMVLVHYQIEETDAGVRLVLHEKNLVLLDREEALAEPDEEEFVELIPAAESMSFGYWRSGKEDEAAEWQPSWDPEEEKGFPLAIRFTHTESGQRPPVQIIARIASLSTDEGPRAANP